MSSFDTPIASSPPNPSSGSGILSLRSAVGIAAGCGGGIGPRECRCVSCRRNEMNKANMLIHINAAMLNEMIFNTSKICGMIWDLSLFSISR